MFRKVEKTIAGFCLNRAVCYHSFAMGVGEGDSRRPGVGESAPDGGSSGQKRNTMQVASVTLWFRGPGGRLPDCVDPNRGKRGFSLVESIGACN